MSNSPHRESSYGRDEGMALMFAMVFVIVGSLIVIPLLNYGAAVTKSSRVLQSKTARAEATKAAFRSAMADPSAVYAACASSGLTQEEFIASAPLAIPVETSCTTLASTNQSAAGDLRVAMTTTWAGSVAPPGTVGQVYTSPVPDPAYWPTDATSTSTGGMILLPQLPVHSTKHPSTSGYMMPGWAGACRVFFPGTYDDPVTISDSTPTFFASGVYYFTDSLIITGSANVVVGGGAVEGCTSNQDAAYFAINAPTTHSITGYGATFLFGGTGRFVIDDSHIPGDGVNFVFNNRLVADQELTVKSSQDVSIATVNGVLTPGGVEPLNMPGQLFVPENLVYNGSTTEDAAAQDYMPSTLVPSSPVAVPGTAVVDINLNQTNASSVVIDGYVAVPQGAININTAAAAAPNKTVSLLGGVLAAQVNTSADLPASLTAGLVNRVVQRTFKIVSETTTGKPVVRSEAIVKINEYGQYVVSNWVVQSCKAISAQNERCSPV
jgi:hypothetical protein